MENTGYKLFEEVHEEKILNACVDTAFTLHGDEGFTVNVLHDFMKDVWFVETSFKGQVFSLTEYPSLQGVIQYLATKEDTYLPAIGMVYDDLLHLTNSKDTGVFNVSTKVSGLIELPEEFQNLETALKLLGDKGNK